MILHYGDASGQATPRQPASRGPATAETARPATQSGGDTAATPGSEDRRAAAEAFDQGTARFLRQDFVGAANWFETANRLAPAPSALQSAIQAHTRAGGPDHNARAASLALQLRARYATDERSMRLATRTLDQLGPQLARVTVRCGSCEIEVDGGIQFGSEFFVAPARHRIVANWSQRRTRDQSVELRAGAAETVTFEEPPMPVAVVATPAVRPEATPVQPTIATTTTTTTGLPADNSSRGLHPGVFVAGVVITAAVGAIAIFSWVDALAQGSALLMHAEQTHTRDPAAEDSLITAENRTTGLVIGTGVAGAATIVCLLLTLSGGSSSHASAMNHSSHRLQVAPVFGREGYQGFALQGTF